MGFLLAPHHTIPLKGEYAHSRNSRHVGSVSTKLPQVTTLIGGRALSRPVWGSTHIAAIPAT